MYMSSISNVKIETETVQDLIRSDPTAQENVYRAFAIPVYNMVSRVLQDMTLAEDVTQDIFVEVLRKAKTLKNPNSFAGWLQKVAINQCYKHLRSPWFRRVGPVDSESGIDTGSEDPSVGVHIDRIFNRMSPKHRLVVWLYCIEGYSHEEIAKTLGRTTSYSKSILSRANALFERANDKSHIRNVTPTFQDTWRAIQ